MGKGVDMLSRNVALAFLLLLTAPVAATGTEARVPVTSVSPVAVKAFLHGRDLMDGQRWSEARAEFQRALKLDPTFALAQAYLGHTTGGPEGAAMLLKANSEAANLPEAERLSIQQLLAERRGELGRSRELLQQIVTLAPGDWHAFYRLGTHDQLENRFEQAVTSLRRAIALNPRAAASYNTLGYALALSGNFDEGISTMRKYAKMLPAEPNPSDSLGEVLMMAGRLREAEAAFRHSTAIDPSFWIGWTGVAEARAMQNRLDESRAAAQVARKTPGRNRLFCDVFIAWTYLIENRQADALALLDRIEQEGRAIQEPAFLARVLRERGWIQLESGQLEEGLRQIEKGLGRLDQTSMLGEDRSAERRRGLGMLVVAQLRKDDEGGLAATVSQLGKLTEQEPGNGELQSVLHHARGALSMVRKDLPAAQKELEQCGRRDGLCQLDLLHALELSKDSAGVEKLRRQLIDRPVRDQIYGGEDPINLYVRAKLQQTATR